ncbi:MAG: GSCFA domain-containing protein [Bacteroidota bacterium]
MNLLAPIHIKPLPTPITHDHKVMMIGSCFTEHIDQELMDLKFQVLQNPNGILFETASICRSLTAYLERKEYAESDLFQFNELWQSWDHHSRFSDPQLKNTISNINKSQSNAYNFIIDADWLLITLGSSYVYRLKDQDRFVANCHKAPAQWFDKYLITIEEQVSWLDNIMHRLFHINPKLKIVFTISPVRHLRDGVIDNNRSKARLIETVHHLVNKFDRLFYFPAYELVVDVLRDYRFYDIDLAHPNYAATRFVMDHFADFAFDEPTRKLNQEIREIVTAARHKPIHPESALHKVFLEKYRNRTNEISLKNPGLYFGKEMKYFSSSSS